MQPDGPVGALRQAQLREACATLDRRLRAGHDCQSEELLHRYPALAADTDSALDLIWTECETRRQLGQPVACEAVCQRFPQWRGDLENLFASAATLASDSPPRPFEDHWELEDYQPVRQIGLGPMGEVWHARQVSTQRDVVVKLFAGGDRNDLERFRRGALDQARLRHANIVPVHEVGEYYFAMELGAGGSLDQQIAGRPLPPAQSAGCVQILARAMHYAHEQGIVHRDLKPANVVLSGAGSPMITDFGLAKHLDGASAHTQPGALVGTLPYMAPEQLAGKHQLIDRRTDIYALGVILYEMLTGEVPFAARSPLEFLLRVRLQPPARMRKLSPAVPPSLESICLHCLEKKPRRRYATAQDLVDDLARWLDGRRPRAHRPLARASRFLRTHPIRYTVTAILALTALCAMVAVPTANYYLDPDRVAKDNAAELARGKSVTLIGAMGEPRWRRWAIGDASVVQAPAGDGAFSISTRADAYLELMPVMPADGFHFHVQVRHESSGVGGEVGVYFARSAVRTPGGSDEHAFGRLSFNDLKHVAINGDGKRLYVAALAVSRYRAPQPFRAMVSPTLSLPIAPALTRAPSPQPWRRLRVTMQGNEVSASWDGQNLGTTTTSKLIDAFRKDANNPGIPQSYQPGLNPSFAPVGGLGIYIVDGWASFRDAVVDPLQR